MKRVIVVVLVLISAGAISVAAYLCGVYHAESILQSHIQELTPAIQKITGEHPIPASHSERADFWTSGVELPLCDFGDGYVRYYVGYGGSRTVRLEFQNSQVTNIEVE